MVNAQKGSLSFRLCDEGGTEASKWGNSNEKAFKTCAPLPGVVVTHGNYDITAWTDETHSEDGTVYWGHLAGERIIVK